MRIINFAKRNLKEIIREPLSVIFSIILPLFLLYIFQQFNLPDEIYKIENFTPGIIIFSFSFITLFTATLVATDRSTSFLIRLCASPMKIYEYILGYTLAIIPIVLLQNFLFFTLALILGLKFSISIIFTILVSFFVSILFIGLGLLIGSVTTEKSASGISSVVVQLVAFTSGMYFSTELVGKTFRIICDTLPFSKALNVVKGILQNNYNSLFSQSIVLFIYTIVIFVLAIIVFKRKLESDNK